MPAEDAADSASFPNMHERILHAAVDDVEAGPQETMLSTQDSTPTPPSATAAATAAAAGPSTPAPPPPTQFRRTSAQCSPCSPGRCVGGIGGALVPGLALITFIPFVVQNPDLPQAGAVVDVAIFLILLGCLLTAWLQTALVDPGTTPLEWHQAIARSNSEVRQRYQLCPKTQRYRPPRSHFDSVSRRVVLNMDHFCPWVANTVGYYNRKFFLLFLFYVVLATGCKSAAPGHSTWGS